MKEPKITKELIAEHGLTNKEYQKVVKALGRKPTYTELGIFSVMWSEHCSYKSSKLFLNKLPTGGKQVIQGPGENAGVIDIGDDLAVVFKIESHNHPSFIEPYQGAATGVGGILRDIFTMGARPIASLNSLRFGLLNNPKNKYLLSGVVSGIAGYGNCMGVPTVGGEIYFSESYDQNPLVNVFNLGLAHKDNIFLGQAAGVGNPVIYVGSKTGKDGIHGATMASEEFDETSAERRPTVQVGDPFTEKLLLEACLELMKTDYIVGIQDMGAAGLTCSTSEMASRGNTGVEIDISLIPRREEGMSSYEVMLSESQERMLLVAKQGKEKEIEKIFEKWDLHAVTIGRVTDDKLLTVKDNKKIIAQIPVHQLVKDCPIYRRPLQKPAYLKTVQSLNINELLEPKDYNQVLLRIISSPTIGSKEWVYQQYDHMVRINSAVLPGSDAAVIRIQGNNKAIGLTVDGNSLYCYLDPHTGGMIAVAEAARNLACSGAKPIAVTNCLNFGNPEKPEIMWQFVNVIEGMGKACTFFGTPVTGGNVSFYNETLGEAIYPTPVIGMVGILEESNLHTTQWFKDNGDIIVLLGETKMELGGTEYLKIIHGLEKGMPPAINLEREKAVQNTCLTAIKEGILKSAHDCSEGGLIVALAESCVSNPNGNIGVDIKIPLKMRTDILLFSESQSRILVSLNSSNLPKLKKIVKRYKIPLQILGTIGGDRLTVKGIRDNEPVEIEDIIDISVNDLGKSWREAVSKYFDETEE